MGGADVSPLGGMPRAEVRVTEDQVRELVERQHPDLAGNPVRILDEGWDNFTFRLGSAYAVRLPRRRAAVALIEKEQRWLPRVAAWVPFDVPTPLRVGKPCDLFSWPWSVVPWIYGRTVERGSLSPTDARTLATASRSLHRPAEDGAPQNPDRPLALATRDEVVSARLERLGVIALARLWRWALDTPPPHESVWIHGDLHPRNVVVRDGAISGLLDWGDMAASDRATDLACAWTLFEAPAREVFLDAYQATPAERARAVGWAVSFASGMLDSRDARHVPIGEVIARRLLTSA
jgi:aminoglycoside phosphotransferase (APT) family kinase protein